MNKTILATALLGAFAASAMAADVTLYGIIDEGVVFSSVKTGSAKRVNNFTLESGTESGSRWGLRAVEDLGNGFKVGFNLESGFTADNGVSAQGGRLFGRESLIYVTSPYGEIGLGRTGGAGAAGVAGRYARAGMLTAFGPAWSKYTSMVTSAIGENAPRMDNSVTYQTPLFAGFQAAIQYSFKMDDVKGAGEEGHASADRFYGASLTYKNGPFAALLSSSSKNKASSGNKVDDSFEVTLGGSYDFGVAKVYLSGQYYDDFDKAGFQTMPAAAPATLKGYGVLLSASAPLGGGRLIGGMNWMDAESASDSGADKDKDFKRLGASLGYTYPFSKRTDLWSILGVGQDKVKASETTKVKYYKVGVGIRHCF
jgi:predicted porin